MFNKRIGTSKQISIGTFAVISLMVASTLADLEPKYVPPVSYIKKDLV